MPWWPSPTSLRNKRSFYLGLVFAARAHMTLFRSSRARAWTTRLANCSATTAWQRWPCTRRASSTWTRVQCICACWVASCTVHIHVMIKVTTSIAPAKHNYQYRVLRFSWKLLYVSSMCGFVYKHRTRILIMASTVERLRTFRAVVGCCWSWGQLMNVEYGAVQGIRTKRGTGVGAGNLSKYWMRTRTECYGRVWKIMCRNRGQGFIFTEKIASRVT